MNTDPNQPEPDGWILIHHRAYGPSCYFGPFPTFEAAVEWSKENLKGGGMLTPLWLTVDWNR